MNIKEHLEAGHYPFDEAAGAYSVVLRNNTTAKIFTTKCGGPMPIVGVVSALDKGWCATSWDANGSSCGDHRALTVYDTLPPPPRKVKVTAWAKVHTETGHVLCSTTDRDHARGWRDVKAWTVVELTGEYEEPWPTCASSKSTEA